MVSLFACKDAQPLAAIEVVLAVAAAGEELLAATVYVAFREPSVIRREHVVFFLYQYEIIEQRDPFPPPALGRRPEGTAGQLPKHGTPTLACNTFHMNPIRQQCFSPPCVLVMTTERFLCCRARERAARTV